MDAVRMVGASLSAVSEDDVNSQGNRSGLKAAAREFEALLVAHLLRSARQGAAGEDEADKTGASLMEMGEEKLAEVLTTQGGLGLAKLIVERMGSSFEKAVGKQATRTSADQPIRSTGG